MNAKEELLNRLKHNAVTLKCATVSYDYYADDRKVTAVLKVDHTQDDLEAFLGALDWIEYDNSYGTQMLFGTLWYTDGTWSERWEYDGSEGWTHHKRPPVPKELR